ncbi:hypothetical protein U27_03202 [Candidatus Vecturithrix granuli]|uniref:Uncharacterized protein n=1 Tax=Vecturithrix granuli TaxID=1499967 RepID=A0A081BV85_VECG1|nr:hypothetical protein U27_03202 [Candidatus Vecturithrix granuli]
MHIPFLMIVFHQDNTATNMPTPPYVHQRLVCATSRHSGTDDAARRAEKCARNDRQFFSIRFARSDMIESLLYNGKPAPGRRYRGRRLECLYVKDKTYRLFQ